MPKKPVKKSNVSRSDKNNLKPKANGFGGGGSGIFTQFEAAKYSNKRQWVNTPWPADQKKVMTTFDRQELTRKMRWLSVNAGQARQMISDNVIYSVGDGIRPQPASGEDSWDHEAMDYFLDWADKPCDITNRYNFWESQQLVCRRVDVDGEIFILKTYAVDGVARIQMIESHRIGNSNSAIGTSEGMYDGILFNKFGAVVGYNVIRSDGSVRLVNSNSMLHVYHAENVSGARAYSPMQHSINNLIDILEILSLEKLAVKTSTDITRTITRENPQFDGSTADFEAFGMRPQDYPNGVYDNPEQVGSFIGGKILSLAPGEKLESFQSNRPNPTFTGFIEHMQKDSAAGVLPYQFTSDPNGIGGAAIRLVVSKAERHFNSRQHMLITRFLKPIWGYVIGNAIASGRLRPNENWHKVNWVTPRKVTVDAGRESSANQKDIEMGLKTLSENFAEQGKDPRQEIRQRAADAKLIMDTAKEFNIPVSMIFQPSSNAQTDIDEKVGPSAAKANKDNDFKPLTDE
jgi:lambda family phage portal protein